MTLYMSTQLHIIRTHELEGETQNDITKMVKYWGGSFFFSETVVFTLIFDMFPSLHQYLLGQAENDIEQK